MRTIHLVPFTEIYVIEVIEGHLIIVRFLVLSLFISLLK